MAVRMNLKESIDMCLDSIGMCAVLETYFTTVVTQKLTKILSDVKTMLLKSRRRTKDKQSVIPEYLENVENIIDLVNIMEKLPKMVKKDLALWNERKPDKDQHTNTYELPQTKEGDSKLLEKEDEVLKSKRKLHEYEQHREMLTTQLHQLEIRNEIAVRTSKSLEEDKRKLEQQLWDLREQFKNKDSKPGDIHEQQGTHLRDIRTEICLEESEIIKEYTSLTEEKWFRAKEALDDHFPPDMDETSKLEVLCDIIMFPWENIKNVVSYLLDAIDQEEVLCQKILDNHFSQVIQTQLKVCQLVKNLPVILEFIKVATRVSFAMVLHKPQIYYRVSKDKYLGEDVQDLYWNSVFPVTEKYHVHNVFPAMCRGETVLVKGRVFLSQFSYGSYV